MSDEIPRMEVRVRDSPRTPQLVVRENLSRTRFVPPPRAWVNFRHMQATDVDFRHARFYILDTSGCLFARCDFRHLQISFGGTLSGRSQSVFRECRFDDTDLSPLDPGTARFEACTFDRATLRDWNGWDAEFIDCHFAGRVEGAMFWGRAPGLKIFKKRRANEFRGNDFREAELIDTSFKGGIDLDAQRLPTGEAYIRLDRMAERIARVRQEVLNWPEGEARFQALGILDVYEGYPREKQDDVFTRRDNLELNPGARDRVLERVLEMLERAVP